MSTPPCRPAHAGRTQPAALAGKRHAHLVAAAAARGNEEAALNVTAAQQRLELVAHELGEAAGLPVETLDETWPVLAHERDRLAALGAARDVLCAGVTGGHGRGHCGSRANGSVARSLMGARRRRPGRPAGRPGTATRMDTRSSGLDPGRSRRSRRSRRSAAELGLDSLDAGACLAGAQALGLLVLLQGVAVAQHLEVGVSQVDPIAGIARRDLGRPAACPDAPVLRRTGRVAGDRLSPPLSKTAAHR